MKDNDQHTKQQINEDVEPFFQVSRSKSMMAPTKFHFFSFLVKVIFILFVSFSI
jgi:hypothetical protein